MVLVDRVELEQRLQQHLRTVDTAFPSAWRDLARARVTHDRASRVRWPRWCWVPTGVADPIVERGQRPTRSPQERLEALAAGPVVVGLGAWRIGKGVYRFDDTLATALDTADGVDMIDPLVLHALPEWCVYILDDHRLAQTTPSGPVTAVVHGYFVWLDHDLGSGRPELRLLLDLDDGHLAPAVAYLDRSSLYDGVLDAVASTIVTVLGDSPADLHLDGDLDRLGGHTARVAVGHQMNPEHLTGVFRAAVAEQVEIVQRVIRRVLYLVSERPDLVDIDQPDRTPEPADAGDPRKPWTAAQAVDWWDVGYRIGTHLRAATDTHQHGGPTGRHVRPHVRRAHWHTYRVGVGKTGRVLRFILPTLVAAGDLADTLPIVEHPVRSPVSGPDGG